MAEETRSRTNRWGTIATLLALVALALSVVALSTANRAMQRANDARTKADNIRKELIQQTNSSTQNSPSTGTGVGPNVNNQPSGTSNAVPNGSGE